jgi:hypothetical protein
MRHDKVGAQLHYSICKALGTEMTDEMVHTHTPKTVCEHEDVTVLWNQWVHTDREVTANKPDTLSKQRNGIDAYITLELISIARLTPKIIH